MKRAQSAKTTTRLHTIQTQHKAFTSMLKTVSPSAAWGSLTTRSDPDLLIQLRRYRLKGSAGVPPLSASSTTSNLGSLKKGILLTPREPQPYLKRSDSTHSKHVSIVQTARTIEAFPPHDPQFPVAVQEDANERLFRGCRAEVSPRPETLRNPLFKFADIVDQGNVSTVRNEQIERERNAHKHFIQSIRVLKELVFELELNYETAHAEGDFVESDGEGSQLGAYYRLVEELQKGLTMSTGELLAQSRATFGERLANYSKMIRSMLRDMKRKGLENECVMLELMWKLIVKMFDSAMELHDYTLNEAVEITKNRVRAEIEKRRKHENEMKEKWRKEEEQLRELLRRSESNAAFLSSERDKLGKELNDRQGELAKLTDTNQRENAVAEMQHLYKKMSSYLHDSELEQTKQAAALEGVEVIMNAVKRMQQRPTLKTVAVMTDEG